MRPQRQARAHADDGDHHDDGREQKAGPSTAGAPESEHDHRATEREQERNPREAETDGASSSGAREATREAATAASTWCSTGPLPAKLHVCRRWSPAAMCQNVSGSPTGTTRRSTTSSATRPGRACRLRPAVGRCGTLEVRPDPRARPGPLGRDRGSDRGSDRGGEDGGRGSRPARGVGRHREIMQGDRPERVRFKDGLRTTRPRDRLSGTGRHNSAWEDGTSHRLTRQGP